MKKLLWLVICSPLCAATAHTSELSLHDLSNTIPAIRPVTSSSKLDAAGNGMYKTTYPLALQRGLVIVETPHWQSVKANVLVTRHNKNEVIIKAALTKSVVERSDLHHSNSSYDRKFYQDKVWTPYWDNSIRDMDNYEKPIRYDVVRVGNRLLVQLREAGTYHVTLPNDADAQVTTNDGDIMYASGILTSLSIDSKTVNEPGHSGSSTSEGQSWTYPWGSDNDPATPTTTLKAKSGHIELWKAKIGKYTQKEAALVDAARTQAETAARAGTQDLVRRYLPMIKLENPNFKVKADIDLKPLYAMAEGEESV